jgi:protein gp37
VRSKTTFNDPLKWVDPRRIFVCSLSDFFHPAASEWLLEALDVMHRAPQHTYMILTKRPEMLAPWGAIPWELMPNVWLGVTAENQTQANLRIPLLMATHPAKRFISIEPMLGPIWLRPDYFGKPDWVIVGGESGPNRRELNLNWLDEVVTQCQEARIPVWVKQDSGHRPGRQGRIPDELWIQELPEEA